MLYILFIAVVIVIILKLSAIDIVIVICHKTSTTIFKYLVVVDLHTARLRAVLANLQIIMKTTLMMIMLIMMVMKIMLIMSS